MAKTLLLDRSTWDCCLNASGNIALASEPYSKEQDVASECRVFEGECYYDTTIGIPYFGAVLGVPTPVQIYKEKLVAAAERVPGVGKVTVYLTEISERKLGGQVQFDGGVVAL